MEADWEFEVGAGAPVIDACWPGFVDLRGSGQSTGEMLSRVRSLAEVVQLPALAEVLTRLNADGSPVWTSKCDFWPTLATEEFDKGEMNAGPGDAAHAMGCYIDLLPRGDEQWRSHAQMEAAIRRMCATLHTEPMRCCRADLVVRVACIANSRADASVDFGITAYITACGATPNAARLVLEAALATFARVIYPKATVQSEGMGE